LTNTITKMPRLTESGLGVRLGHREYSSIIQLARAVRDAALETGFVLVDGLDLSRDDFQTLVHEMGSAVASKYREGRSDLLELKASREQGKVITGRGPLPIHTDGLLIGQQTDLIILYAADFDDRPGSGETFVCDQLAAWRSMPKPLADALEHDGLEYIAEERDYYPADMPEGWYRIDTTRDYGRVRSLNLALPFPSGSPSSWQVRVAGKDSGTSEEILRRLDEHLRQARYVYQHQWSKGDLMVIDNQRTLHGRTAVSPGGTRLLYRGQVTLGAAY